MSLHKVQRSRGSRSASAMRVDIANHAQKNAWVASHKRSVLQLSSSLMSEMLCRFGEQNKKENIFKRSTADDLLGRVPGEGIGADPVGDFTAELNNLGVAVAVANVFEKNLEFPGALLTPLFGGRSGNLV